MSNLLESMPYHNFRLPDDGPRNSETLHNSINMLSIVCSGITVHWRWNVLAKEYGLVWVCDVPVHLCVCWGGECQASTNRHSTS